MFHLVAGYAPTSSADSSQKQQFVDDLSGMMQQKRQSDIMLVGGDFNAALGDHTQNDNVCGQYGLPILFMNSKTLHILTFDLTLTVFFMENLLALIWPIMNNLFNLLLMIFSTQMKILTLSILMIDFMNILGS